MAVKESAHGEIGTNGRAREILLSQEIILLIILIAGVLILSTQSEQFLTVDNLLNQGRLMAEVALIALPMTYIIITGGIDLSVGSTMGLSAIVLGYSWENIFARDPNLLPVAIVIALLVGGLGGLVNGLFIVRMGIPPLITTLATLALYRGLAEGISQNRSVRNYPEWFYGMGQGNLFGIPSQLILFAIAAVIFAIILARTPFGRALYAIGNNEVGSRFSGLPVDRYKLIIYTISGFMAAISGYLLVSRVTTTRSDMGTGQELDVIAAVVLGGTSIFGGTGSIAGTVIGIILIQLLKNGLALAQVPGDATIVVVGLVLILAILVNKYIQRRTHGGD
jgi:rhamnose transport system permease protein